MQTVKYSLLTLICLALLGACGLKGPLYLPNESPAAKAATEQESVPDLDSDEAEEDEDEGVEEEDVGRQNSVPG